jgi:cell division protein YceG involved in septum cleavage
MEGSNLFRPIRRRSITNNIITFIENKGIFIMFGIITLCILILSFCIVPTVVTAEKLMNREKNVISVKIEEGDTLWSIASEYITEEYNDINSYIREIKKSNGLTNDTIHEGRYIIVPYYTAKR